MNCSLARALLRTRPSYRYEGARAALSDSAPAAHAPGTGPRRGSPKQPVRAASGAQLRPCRPATGRASPKPWGLTCPIPADPCIVMP